MGDSNYTVSGNIIDVCSGEDFFGEIKVENGCISSITKEGSIRDNEKYILPGLVNSHGHVESSLLIPSEFAKAATVCGEVGGVYDPHELANVCGIDGVRFMIEDGKRAPFKFAFGAPSCVPATNPEIETSGASLGVSEVGELLENGEAKFLSEVMNAPAVIGGEPSFLEMINKAKSLGLKIDGHCPGFGGDELQKYIDSGISTDHECTSLEEAKEKLHRGLAYVLIREGSAAKNFDALHPLFKTHPDRVMLCSDDIHPHDLVKGHMNRLVARAISLGYDPIAVIASVTKNPVLHYRLPVGLLQRGDAADFIIVDSLKTMNVYATYINGNLVAENGKCLFDVAPINSKDIINKFECNPISVDDVLQEAEGSKIRLIGVSNGQLLTSELIEEPTVVEGFISSDISRDICKLVVVNRYVPTKPAIGFVKGLGLKEGAIASSVSHDCHQIVVAGVSDEDIVASVNAIINAKGGLAVSKEGETHILPLPVGGIMSDRPLSEVASLYEKLHRKSIEMGSQVEDSMMMLSFLALSVIPELKLTDKGLFKITEFSHVGLFV